MNRQRIQIRIGKKMLCMFKRTNVRNCYFITFLGYNFKSYVYFLDT